MQYTPIEIQRKIENAEKAGDFQAVNAMRAYLKKELESNVGGFESALRGAGQGVFGGGDEIEAGFKTLFNGGSYDDNLFNARAYNDAAYENNPWAAYTGDVVSSIASSVLGGGAILKGAQLANRGLRGAKSLELASKAIAPLTKASKAPALASSIGNAGKIVGTAALESGMRGFGEGEGLSNRLENAGQMGLAGGALGAAGGVAGKIIGKGIKAANETALANKAKEFMNYTAAEGKQYLRPKTKWIWENGRRVGKEISDSAQLTEDLKVLRNHGLSEYSTNPMKVYENMQDSMMPLLNEMDDHIAKLDAKGFMRTSDDLRAIAANEAADIVKGAGLERQAFLDDMKLFDQLLKEETGATAGEVVGLNASGLRRLVGDVDNLSSRWEKLNKKMGLTPNQGRFDRLVEVSKRLRSELHKASPGYSKAAKEFAPIKTVENRIAERIGKGNAKPKNSKLGQMMSTSTGAILGGSMAGPAGAAAGAAAGHVGSKVLPGAMASAANHKGINGILRMIEQSGSKINRLAIPLQDYLLGE